MESRDGKCNPFDGVYSRVFLFSISLRLETNALLSEGFVQLQIGKSAEQIQRHDKSSESISHFNIGTC